MKVLGVSGYYHDSAAALVVDGELVAAIEEERLSRKKHDASLPRQAIAETLRLGGVKASELDRVVFYDNPWGKLRRVLATYVSIAPRGVSAFHEAARSLVVDRTRIKQELRSFLGGISPQGEISAQFTYCEHHRSHAASAFYPSPFREAAVICVDGVGEMSTATVWTGEGNELLQRREIRFPHSLGLFYSTFTSFLGFKVNSGEYKVMGLAPYGRPKYLDQLLQEVIDLRPDGSFLLNLEYFGYLEGNCMYRDRLSGLLGLEPRAPESALRQEHMDLASSVQAAVEQAMSNLAGWVRKTYDKRWLCLAGGVALNCVANGKLRRLGLFDDIWVQPAAGDAGGAVGAAFDGYFRDHSQEPSQRAWICAADEGSAGRPGGDGMKGAFLGTAFTNEEILAALKRYGVTADCLEESLLFEAVAATLAGGAVVGWFQGRMEFGPRALGARSILGDPRRPDMQRRLNLKIKNRESFRPFAPAVLEEKREDWFAIDCPSPYMSQVAPVAESRLLQHSAESDASSGLDRLDAVRSEIPAVTHVDHSARVQTVSRTGNPRFWALLQAFEEQTGVPVLVNTSFNVRGEPIVRTPEEAIRCFLSTEMDALAIGDYLVMRERQPRDVLKRGESLRVVGTD